MTNDGSKQSVNVWPLPKFYFQVKFGDYVLSFQEISGLDVESQTIEYRHGDNPVFSSVKLPGIKKYGNVTMKKCVFQGDRQFFDMLNQIKDNSKPIKRFLVTISLLDEMGKATMVWTLHNAWPIKMSYSDLQFDGNDVAIESIEFAHEGLNISNG